MRLLADACRTDTRVSGAQMTENMGRQSFHSLYMNSNKRDALHPANLPPSFMRPVWWQNPTAEMQRGLEDALEDLQAVTQEDKCTNLGSGRSPVASVPTGCATRIGPGGVPRPVRLDICVGSDTQGARQGMVSSRGSCDQAVGTSNGGCKSLERRRSRSEKHISIWGSRNSWDSRRDTPRARSSSTVTPQAKSTGADFNV
jgi:hypothetical protein